MEDTPSARRRRKKQKQARSGSGLKRKFSTTRHRLATKPLDLNVNNLVTTEATDTVDTTAKRSGGKSRKHRRPVESEKQGKVGERAKRRFSTTRHRLATKSLDPVVGNLVTTEATDEVNTTAERSGNKSRKHRRLVQSEKQARSENGRKADC